MAGTYGEAVLVVVGPTASGKSATAIRLAEILDGEIISADSMMVYRGMDIGTAKPPAVLRQVIPHHLIDIADPSEEFSAAAYQPLARRAIKDVIARGKLPILAGGTGLYVGAAIDNLNFPSLAETTAVREDLQADIDLYGAFAMHQRLAEIDPTAAAAIHVNNTRRLIRAMEVYLLTGERFSEAGDGFKKRIAIFDTVFTGIEYDREELYRRINIRTDKMISAGWAEETAAIFAAGPVSKTASKAIGYAELKRYLDGEVPLETAAELIKTATRRYAKRQMTWFKADSRITWFERGAEADAEAAADAIELYFKTARKGV